MKSFSIFFSRSLSRIAFAVSFISSAPPTLCSFVANPKLKIQSIFTCCLMTSNWWWGKMLRETENRFSVSLPHAPSKWLTLMLHCITPQAHNIIPGEERRGKSLEIKRTIFTKWKCNFDWINFHFNTFYCRSWVRGGFFPFLQQFVTLYGAVRGWRILSATKSGRM